MLTKCFFRLALAFGLAALVAPAARADVKLHPLFTDHAVFQRGTPIPVWGTADPGEEVKVRLSTSGQATATATADKDGRWSAKLPAQQAGGPFELTVSGKNTLTLKDVLVGEVWVCSGQSNMEWSMRQCQPETTEAIAQARHPMIRLFTVQRNPAPQPQTTLKGEWKECTPETAVSFSAVAYFFGRDVHKAINVPVGLIHTSWGGTSAQAWTSKEALAAEPSLRYYPEQFAKAVQEYTPERAQLQLELDQARYDLAQARHKVEVAQTKLDGKPAPRAPTLIRPQRSAPHPASVPNSTTLYNGMLAPVIPYAIKGVIWYQGESNAGKAYEYRTLFATLIKDWRARWGQGDFPFLCVQLAPWNAGPNNTWPELREAQLLATQTLPKVGMAVITDVGERNDIHPKKKEPVGARLALLARKIAYGENLVAMGPVYKAMKVEGNRAVLSFDNVGTGLECRGPALTGFQIAGDDQKFHPADAEVRGDTVVVSSKEVERPVAVRYGWANYPEVNLWNKDGLPATPFRTDTWPGITQPQTAQGEAK